MKTISNYRLATALGLLTMSLAGTVDATVISGSSAGYGAYVDVSALAGALSLAAGPVPSGASGSAPATYSLNATQASLGLTDNACITAVLGVCTLYAAVGVQTGLLSGDAASDVDGGSGSRFASAMGEVDNAGVNAGTGTLLNLFSTLTLGLSSTTLASTAQVSGDYGAFSATGSSIIEGASLQVAGIGLIALDANAAPNTFVDPLGALSALGLTVVLNEQTSNCAAVSCDIAVNALRLGFTNFALGTALLNGDIIFGHSEAQLVASPSAVPVPAAVWLFGSGLMGLLGMARRSRMQ